MKELIQFFTSFGNLIISVLSFLFMTIVETFMLIMQIPSYLAFITESVTILPGYILPFVLAFVSLSVMQYLINKKAG